MVELPIQVEPLGDAALIVRLPNAPISPLEALATLLRVQRLLQAASIAGLVEVTTAYTSVAVFYDPVLVRKHAGDIHPPFDWLKCQVTDVLSSAPVADKRAQAPSRVLDVPVCYHPEFALDLADVARQADLPIAEVVRRHSAAEYVVQCVGFTPGFPYLEGLPPELATPRRSNPRTRVPAGSVAIGGAQTGIYPLTSPGGWNVIGRTPLILFRADREQPALLRAGDRLRFYAISAEEFRHSPESPQPTINKSQGEGSGS